MVSDGLDWIGWIELDWMDWIGWIRYSSTADEVYCNKIGGFSCGYMIGGGDDGMMEMFVWNGCRYAVLFISFS